MPILIVIILFDNYNVLWEHIYDNLYCNIFLLNFINLGTLHTFNNTSSVSFCYQSVDRFAFLKPYRIY